MLPLSENPEVGREIDSAIEETEPANLARVFRASAGKKIRNFIKLPYWLKAAYNISVLGLSFDMGDQTAPVLICGAGISGLALAQALS